MAPGNKFACLMYHAIGNGPGQYTVSEKKLREQLAFLKSKGYLVEGFKELEARLHSRQELPVRYVVLTVDDGGESSIRAADVFAENECKATFFLTRDRSQKMSGFIREAEIQQLWKRGFSLGTHGTSHRGLSLMRMGDCIAELKESKQWLEDVIGDRVIYMSAPGGYVDRRTMKLAHEQGYVLVGTSNEWMNSPAIMSLLGKVNRVAVRRHFSMQHLRYIVEGDLRFYLWRQVRAATLAVPKKILWG